MEHTYYQSDDGTLTILHGNTLELTLIPDESIDLIVTSPPYNIDIAYRTSKDDIPYEEYLAFSKRWLEKTLGLMKADGRLCLNIPLDKNRRGQQSVYADIISLAKKAGWNYHATIIWNEGNISRRTAWGSFRSARAPYVIAPVEAIAILYRSDWRKNRKGDSDILKEEFIEWTNGLWTFSGESRKKIGHPSPFPLELPLRCIKLFSFIGDTVLDPFLGSGTTLLACRQLKRRGIGVDVDEAYCALARNRLLTSRDQAPVKDQTVQG